MAICTFFLKGQCRFGGKCRNEHPAGGQAQGSFGNQSWNRPASNSNTNAPITNTTTLFTVDSIRNDLTPQQDKPLWPLSSYGAAKYETNLISGLDESFEEMRLKASTAIAAGNTNQYMQYESERIANADKVISDARNNVQQAYDQALKQSNVTSMLNNSINPPSGSAFGSSTSAFGSSSSPFGSSNSTSAFGNASSSAFGAAAGSAFAKPSFGQSQSGLGQTSQPSTSVFGQPSQPTSAFGQPSTSAFGQPVQSNSAFGQPSQPTSVFGQSSQPTNSLVKPATSGAFGAYASGGPTAFGAGATPATSSSGGGFAAFANPSGQASTFGGTAPSAFGSSSSSAPTTTSVFGGGGTFGASVTNTTSTPSVFGTQASGTGVFGSSAPSGAFGSAAPASTSVFGSASSAPSAFGSASTPAAPAQPTSVFGSAAPVSAFGSNPSAPSAFGSSGTTSAFGSSSFGGGGFANPPASKKSTSSAPDFKAAMAQSYVAGKCPYDAQLPPNYLSEVVPKDVIEIFKAEKFEWGKVPDWIPPLELR